MKEKRLRGFPQETTIHSGAFTGEYQNRGRRIAILISCIMIPFLFLLYSIFLKFNLLESFEGRLIFSRVFLICIAAYLITVVCLLHCQTLSIIQRFFAAEAYPITLAVFRIVLFWTIFDKARYSRVVWFSQLPADFRIAPVGLDWLLNWLPINEPLATVLSIVFFVSCFTGMIGLYTRTSAFLNAILGFYVLGLPQFYGKVDHYHHLLWFPAILAASRCSDVFSCDAVIAAWRRADRGITAPPEASRAYALPLRFLWLLMGIIYFFPGFAKLWVSGFDWIFSDNLKFHIYDTWIRQIDSWVPFFRVDQYPLLLRLGALGTVIFEMSFIFLIFFPRTRILAVLGGLMFHNMTRVFMRINFRSLANCYVMFLDWHAIFRHIGDWLYKAQMYIVYDGNCRLCRRTIASLRVFDIFGRVTYVNAYDKNTLRDHGLLWLDSTTLMAQMHAIVRRKSWPGFSAYRILAARIPVLWPVLPFLYVWPIPTIANRIYRLIADSRSCSIAAPPLRLSEGKSDKAQKGAPAAVTVGTFLLLVNILYASQGITKSWPFAAYPTFARINNRDFAATIEMVALSPTGEPIEVQTRNVKAQFAAHRYKALITHILKTKDPIQRRTRFKALWSLAVRDNVNLAEADSVRFYEVRLSTIPERWRENPLDRELLFELKLDVIRNNNDREREVSEKSKGS